MPIIALFRHKHHAWQVDMIGKLRGNVDWVDEQEAIIDVGGVGYIVYCSAMTLRSFPPIGNSVQLWI